MYRWRHMLHLALAATLFIAATSRAHTQAVDPSAEFFDDAVVRNRVARRCRFSILDHDGQASLCT